MSQDILPMRELFRPPIETVPGLRQGVGLERWEFDTMYFCVMTNNPHAVEAIIEVHEIFGPTPTDERIADLKGLYRDVRCKVKARFKTKLEYNEEFEAHEALELWRTEGEGLKPPADLSNVKPGTNLGTTIYVGPPEKPEWHGAEVRRFSASELNDDPLLPKDHVSNIEPPIPPNNRLVR